MKPKLLFFLFLGLTLFQSCSTQKLTQSIESSIGEKLYAKFSGTCFVKETNPNSYLLLVNTTKSTDSYDKALILFSEAGQAQPSIDEKAVYEFFIPDNKRYVVIYNHNNDKIFLAGLTDQAARQYIDAFKTKLSNQSVLINQDVLGYGLSYMNGIWNISKIKESQYKQPFNTLDFSNTARPEAARELPPPDDEGGGALCDQGQCTSGGAGSNSCSLTEVGGIGCTVTCNTGYYACCNSSSTRCYCCKIQ